MSIRNQRTRRHEDDLADGLAQGTATVGDVIEHAQEIIVETPEAFGQTTAQTVSILLQVIDILTSGAPVHQNDRVDYLGTLTA